MKSFLYITKEKSSQLQNILDYKYCLRRLMTLFSYEHFLPYLADVMEYSKTQL